VGRTIVATAARPPRANTATGGTCAGSRKLNTTAPTATIAARTTAVRLSVRSVPAAANCNGSSATTTPATSAVATPTSRRPTHSTATTATRLRIDWITLAAHSLSVSHRIDARNAG
jgi:hypothetical protein